jgi:hypothetical protein
MKNTYIFLVNEVTDRIGSFDKSKKNLRKKETWYNEEDDNRMNIIGQTRTKERITKPRIAMKNLPKQ